MSKSPIPLLGHILDEADFVIAATRNVDRDQFLSDPTLTRAIARAIEITGEAVSKLPKELLDRYSDLPWRQMVGMRNRLIHGYALVDYRIVWDVATGEIPRLRARVQQILTEVTGFSDSSSEE
jgi:uncharacterized protein with HEPN domain